MEERFNFFFYFDVSDCITISKGQKQYNDDALID